MSRWLIFLVLALQTVAAHAHKPSDSYLALRPDGERIRSVGLPRDLTTPSA